MTTAQLHRFELDAVRCAAVTPGDVDASLPLCVFLYGGGGSHETLAGIAPLLEDWWVHGTIPPMVVATPDVGPWSFYLDDPDRGSRWETVVTERFVPAVRERFATKRDAGLVGISMGGYAALKMAFAGPSAFRATAAVAPMIEPAFAPDTVPLRNRFHYPPEVPQALLGATRDRALWQRDHPAHRACANAAELRESAPAIYIDAGSTDALHAHDGAEHLHRVLWSLDLRHEYRLRRDADHVGPTLVPRILDAFRFLGEHLAPSVPEPLTPGEQQWARWLDHGGAPPETPLPPTSRLVPRALRAQLAPARAEAEQRDPSLRRCYGALPPVD